MKVNLLTVLSVFAVFVVEAVDRSKFRTCSQTSFCERNRNNFIPQEYHVRPGSYGIHSETSTITAELLNGRHPLQDPLVCKISILQNNVARITINEKTPLHPRWTVPDVLQASALEAGQAELTVTEDGAIVKFGSREIKVVNKPFSVTLSINGEQAIAMNSEGLLNFEQYRNEKNPKPDPAHSESSGEGAAAAAAAEQQDHEMKFPYDVEGMWGESFGGHTDSKPRGPAAVAADITFIGSEQVYGIPEHATDFALKTTKGGDGYNEPYRLYNLDVFEYELDEPMALYGAVPFMLGHDTAKTSAALWLNSAETFIDVSDAGKLSWFERLTGAESKQQQGKQSYWVSESGLIDVFLMVEPNPKDMFFAYNSLTGMPAMPAQFATAYHQCRWNYKSQDDVAQVDAGFDQNDIPYDVLWLDIEHTNGKRYFTWDTANFPSPKEMQASLAGKGRKMVTIVDPHIKKDSGYHVFQEAENQDLYVKNSNKGNYDGWCWPGSSAYLDFCRQDVRSYWAGLFSYGKYEGSTPDLYIWNDMNEPSVFNGPEVTMPKDNLHLHSSVEHREVHNMYGFYHQWATEQGLARRDPAQNTRPFVLTRSFFAGSQKYGAVWTGDNMAKWDHLEAAAPMLLALNVGGITFSGADVGGFFGDPDPELLTRWYQAAAFQPFFRGHAHIDAKRREPWLFGEPHTTHIRDAIRQRYAYLPYIYTTFREAATAGVPIMRPLWLEFPKDPSCFDKGQEWLLGAAILVKAVTTAGQTSTDVYLPGPAVWYDVENFHLYQGQRTVTIDSPITKTPVFQRGGTVVPKRERARRSSAAMVWDPYTLVVALDENGQAQGEVYEDDGKTFDYQKGQFTLRSFKFDGKTLTSSATGSLETYSTVERIVIFGLKTAPQFAHTIDSEGNRRRVEVQQVGLKSDSVYVLRKPDLHVQAAAGQWSVELMWEQSS